MIEQYEGIYIELLRKMEFEDQLGFFYEEVGELLQAINKYKRGKGRITKFNIFEEIIDVQIQLDILKIAYGINPDVYRYVMSIKIQNIKDFLNTKED